MHTDLINLPWQVQVALASGYAAYFTASSGNRSHHQTIDVAFSTLVFGLFATVFYTVLEVKFGLYLAGLGAFLLSTFLGAGWRKFGSAWLRAVLRASRVSFANDDPSALATITSDTQNDLTQISVTLKNGSILICENASQFSKLPFGPCILGPTGDIALYTTHERDSSGVEKPQPTVVDPEHGSRLTYIPSSEIERVQLRFKKYR